MPSAQDVPNAVNATKDAVNNNTTVIGQKLDTLDADLKLTQQLLLWGFEQLITLGQYTNQVLSQNDKQNDTMICILQQISVNTCGIWNEAHIQTDLQKGIEASAQRLAKLYAATHGDAAVTLAREEELLRQIEKCCPPEEPKPVCVENSLSDAGSLYPVASGYSAAAADGYRYPNPVASHEPAASGDAQVTPPATSRPASRRRLGGLLSTPEKRCTGVPR